MASSFGGTVKLSGESEYRKALREITSSLREVSSELKLASVQFQNGEKDVKETKQTYDNANISIKEQRDKVNQLREELIKAEKEYGSNNEKVKSFKTALNNAEIQLATMENQTSKSTNELKNMENSFAEVGNEALKFGDLVKANVLSEAIVGGIKALGNVVKELGSAFVSVGQQALNSYADYEQLIGGVETLFGDSARIVENYANNAYKTAGLSANDYMNTVTSFSASLLQSLNGDTAKSAEVADMAITDMADNANKMGTSMESLQLAYQGFAKQNYTMLDNLKLGYGGSKEEMERLLSDASKISGIEYDISNLNDVYQAIHLIQNELGITGTTAKEASTTIEGSMSTMKAAWQNMLTGIATGNSENIGNLINNLVDSVINAGNNIIPRVQEIIEGIVAVLPQIANRINENLPIILNAGMQILQSLINGIVSTIPSLMPVIINIITELLSLITLNLPSIINAGIQILLALVSGIAQALPEIIPQAINAIILIVETLLDNIDMIIDSGIELILGLADGLIVALPDLIDKIPIIIEKLINAITNNLPKLIEAGITLIIKLAEGLIKAIPQLISKIPQIIKSILDGFANYYSQMGDIGLNLIKGLWNGINDAAKWLWEKISKFCNDLLNKIKGFFGIHSPSTLFKNEIGENLALGLGEGFSETMKDVAIDMQKAIPTEFDVSTEFNTTNNTSKYTSNSNLIAIFKEALKEMKIELNEREIGEFVDKRMAEVI